jgi:hypothetical protein
MTTLRSFADVSEGVRHAIAAYTQALDDGRVEDLVATFCPDGLCDLPGLGRHTGRDALRDAYGRWKADRPMRHLVLNTLITGWDDDQAQATSDVVLLVQGDKGWRIQLVGRYRDVLRHHGGTWRFASRVAEFTP